MKKIALAALFTSIALAQTPNPDDFVEVFVVGSAESNDISFHKPGAAPKFLNLGPRSSVRAVGTNFEKTVLAVAQMHRDGGSVDFVAQDGQVKSTHTGTGDLTQSVACDEKEIAVLSSEKGVRFFNSEGIPTAQVRLSDTDDPFGIGFGNGLYAATRFSGRVIFFKNPNLANPHISGGNIQLEVKNSSDRFRSTQFITAKTKEAGFGAKEVAYGDGIFLVTNSEGTTVSVYNQDGDYADFDTGEKKNRLSVIDIGEKIPKGIAYGAKSFVIANSGEDFSGLSVTILSRNKEMKKIPLKDQGHVGKGPLGVGFMADSESSDAGTFAISASNRVFFMTPEGEILGSQATAAKPTGITAFRVLRSFMK